LNDIVKRILIMSFSVSKSAQVTEVLETSYLCNQDNVFRLNLAYMF